MLLIAVFTLVACGEKEPVQKNVLQLLGDQVAELNFQGWANSEGVVFHAPMNWMVMMDENIDWFTVTPMYGEAGDRTIYVEVFDYSGDSTLNGSFDIVSGNDRLTIKVSQISSTDPNSEFVYIKDDNFREHMLANFDDDGDGQISKSEAEAVKEIICNDKEIKSLEGIKAFTSLRYLDCSYNVIEGVLDLSGLVNLEEAYVDHNIYTSLNLAGCSKLKIVEANDNIERMEDYTSYFHMTDIDLRGCGELLYLELTDNAIAAINLSDCKKLQVLRMTWNNLTSIDVTSCPDLTHLYVRKNRELAGVIDLSNNTKLQEVWCAESKVEGLSLTSEYPDLTKIVSYYSEISSLDLSTCPNLTTLEAHGMKLTSIDLTKCPKLDYLWLKFNSLTELDLTKCPDVREVQIGGNQIGSLDMSKCSKIKLLEVANNALTSVDLSGCAELESLDLSYNKLTAVDLADCDMLFQVSVSGNEIAAFDVANKAALAVLDCSFNKIETLNVTGCNDLRWVYADNNKITHLDLRQNHAIEELALTNNELEELLVSGLKNMFLCEFGGNNLQRLDLSGCSSVNELYVQDNPLAYFSVYDCEGLYQLDMRRTNMKSVDLSNNHGAAFLFAEENPQLETVYISPEASFSTLNVDDHVMVYLYDAENHDDVNSGNWGDEDVDPWTTAA